MLPFYYLENLPETEESKWVFYWDSEDRTNNFALIDKNNNEVIAKAYFNSEQHKWVTGIGYVPETDFQRVIEELLVDAWHKTGGRISPVNEDLLEMIKNVEISENRD